MNTFRTAAFAVATLLATTAAQAQSRELVVNFDDLNPDKKAAFDAVVDDFREANPDINVVTNVQDREAYKTSIRNFLTADAPDVASWYAGNRMRPFVDAGLFEDVSDVWTDNGLDESLSSTMASMTVDGKQYGVPYTYYNWGLYYRADIFEDLGIEPPETFDDLLEASATLKENGVTPITIGTRALWPAAGVFDYLNLRTNGYEFHNQLTAGEVSYTDDRTRETFENWRKLVEPGLLHRQPRLDGLAGGAGLVHLRRGGDVRDGRLRGERDARGRPDGRSDRLRHLPHHQPRSAARRGCADRHVPHPQQRVEQGGRAQVPRLHRLARGCRRSGTWRSASCR